MLVIFLLNSIWSNECQSTWLQFWQMIRELHWLCHISQKSLEPRCSAPKLVKGILQWGHAHILQSTVAVIDNTTNCKKNCDSENVEAMRIQLPVAKCDSSRTNLLGIVHWISTICGPKYTCCNKVLSKPNLTSVRHQSPGHEHFNWVSCFNKSRALSLEWL